MEEINSTAMNVSSSSSWLSDLEMDEYNLFAKECNLNFLDTSVEDFLSHDITINVFQEQNKQQCLTSGSTSTTTLSNTFSDETKLDCFDFNIDKTIMEMKTIDHSDKINETFTQKRSSSFQVQIPSFDSPPNSPTTSSQQYPTLNSIQNERVSVSPTELENKNHSTKTSKTSKTKRSRANNGEDHIMAERKRREKLTQSFIALAALVPNLKKMDKFSVLVDTIKYMKELKKRLEVLEEQNKRIKTESHVILTKPDLCSEDDSSSFDEHNESVVGSIFQVEAKVLGKYMLIRIQCKEYKGLLVKIMVEIQRFQLCIVNSSVLPFGDSIFDITIIAQLGEGYNLSIKELVKNIRKEALKFMSSR
ncbi:putative transcription factor bHLH family [Medicago truncatula]|uniref:Putative transcription factor bHLH family n=1 Tax=Medicago truncatula TaxID=3880 RepID=A0A396JC41_MEDTR|nr:transcription factor bHLH18 [Medicago truncatula]RHN74161.1 putative transcription factor bHLH family [Medicago truncatula]